MKLQKYLAHAGICSRRKAEEYIEQKMVTVNGVIAHIWQVVDPDKDIIKMDDQVIKDQENLVYYVLISHEMLWRLVYLEKMMRKVYLT